MQECVCVHVKACNQIKKDFFFANDTCDLDAMFMCFLTLSVNINMSMLDASCCTSKDTHCKNHNSRPRACRLRELRLTVAATVLQYLETL